METKFSIELASAESLPDGWELRKLQDVADVNQLSSNLKELEWLHYTDIASVGTRKVEKPARLKPKDAPSRARRVLRVGDTVMTTVRPNRKIFFQFNGEWENPIASTGFAVITPKDATDADFLHGLLTSDKAIQLYESFCDSGAYPSFNASRLHDIYLPWPPSELRVAIGQILGNFQRKIAVDRKTVETLMKISASIFDSWFVNFDSRQGLEPSDESGSSELPISKALGSELDYSPLGALPEGWKIGRLSDVAAISKASQNPTKYADTVFQHYSIPAFDDFQFPTSVFGNEILSTKFRIDGPAVLVSKLNPNTPRVWTLPKVSPDSICSTEFIVLKPLKTEYLPFIDGVLRNPAFQEQFASLATGSTGSRQRVRPEDVFHIPIVIPDSEDMTKFCAILYPALELIENLRQQISTISEIRDSLLPRLVFGEIDLEKNNLELA
jgi:type I restriction enzyme S subunit